jgi:hypothetical protein
MAWAAVPITLPLAGLRISITQRPRCPPLVIDQKLSVWVDLAASNSLRATLIVALLNIPYIRN